MYIHFFTDRLKEERTKKAKKQFYLRPFPTIVVHEICQDKRLRLLITSDTVPSLVALPTEVYLLYATLLYIGIGDKIYL